MSGPIPSLLLRWYRAHGRALDWRVSPHARRAGRKPDPYRVWLSEIMLQQTTVAAVAPRFARFVARWPTIEALAAAPSEDVLGEWAGLGYYARARNLIACAKAVAARGGFPRTEAALRELPGVGAYTAAAIAAIAFGRRAVVVDGNVERVAARVFAIDAPLPAAKPQLKAAIAAIWPAANSGDFAQALMDLGASVCTPRAPRCLDCPITVHCRAHAAGRAGELPVKAKKAARPVRRGRAYALVNAKGEVLFERRASEGLLGGMLGLPGSAWTDAAPVEPAPISADWAAAGLVGHAFTHFTLELEVMRAAAPRGFRPAPGQAFHAPCAAQAPTVFIKAARLAVADNPSPSSSRRGAKAA